MPNGDIQPEFTERLTAMGKWLQTYGPTIYGTRRGFIRPQSWGAVTEKGNKVYIHLLNATEEKLFLKVPYKVRAIKTYTGATPVKFQVLPDNYVVIDIKNIPGEEFDTVLEMEILQ